MTDDKLRTELLRAQEAIYNALQTLPKSELTAPTPRQDLLKIKSDPTPQFTADALEWKPTKNPAIEFAFARVSKGGYMKAEAHRLHDLITANGDQSITQGEFIMWRMEKDGSLFRKRA